MEDFAANHKAQLDFLRIPEVFFPSIKEQLERAHVEGDGGLMKQEAILVGGKANIKEIKTSDIGAMLAIPYLCTWDMSDQKGLWDALSELSVPILQEVHSGLKNLWMEPLCAAIEDKETLLNQICDPRIWSRVILYKKDDQIHGAMPAPPFLLQVELVSETDDTEADLSGPFPFQYHLPSGAVVECALAYVNSNRIFEKDQVPTIDFVPPYSVANAQTRCIRYAALLGEDAPSFAIERAKEIHANFVHQMHLVRQQKLEVEELKSAQEVAVVEVDLACESGKVWRVYTDSSDPMELAHSEAGLSKENFVVVDDPNEADIIFSYKSLFAPGPLREVWQNRKDTLINQFPYEGAFVQKDHLGREILKQHGLPRPSWAVETFDLDVQLGEFVGAALLETDRSGGVPPLWIIKPANGTRSQGHVVTRSPGQVLRLVDSGGGSRVAQQYIVSVVSRVFVGSFMF